MKKHFLCLALKAAFFSAFYARNFRPGGGLAARSPHVRHLARGRGRKILKKFGKTLRGQFGNVRNKVSGNRTPILLYY